LIVPPPNDVHCDVRFILVVGPDNFTPNCFPHFDTFNRHLGLQPVIIEAELGMDYTVSPCRPRSTRY
jgi:hypothetical protein